ncbi:hypothetical protein Tco_1020330 [Tanacetum coccineum]|uniref:Uncharacterized protein n=1 Tax=Tanacetum coccineum TaxID=301880 RepID=A0ABQ5G149_9ASTR
MEEERTNGNELKTELKRIHTQIIRLQKKRLGQKDKIAFAHYRISDLEQTIEKIPSIINQTESGRSLDNAQKRTSTSKNTIHNFDAQPATIADFTGSPMKHRLLPWQVASNPNMKLLDLEKFPSQKEGNYK